MKQFVVTSLPSLLIMVLMMSSAVTEKLSKLENKNGKNDRRSGTKNSTREYCNQDVVGKRALAQHNNPNLQCYTQFFEVGQAPTGLRPPNDPNIRYICQPTIPNQDNAHTYYATMFDVDLGIAVFSAYTLTQQTANFPGNQAQVGWCQTPGIQEQGNDDLYKNQGYQRGHLAPALTFSNNRQRYVSTYTYTNAVPQCQSFNGGRWKAFENSVRRYALQCTQAVGTLYLLTGTSFSRFDPQNFPQANRFQINMLHRGNSQIWIPVSLWTAGCCVNGINAESFAVIGNNLQDQVQGTDRSLTQKVTLGNLQIFLRNDAAVNKFIAGQPNVNLFPGNANCVNNDLQNLPGPQGG